MSDKQQKEMTVVKNKLEAAFFEAGWKDKFDKIWLFGSRKCGPNVLLNATNYKQKKFWDQQVINGDSRAIYNNSVINGFQLVTLAGPLCEESVINYDVQSRGQLSDQIMSTFKEACRRIFSLRRLRLVTPMYICNVLVNSDVLVKLYAVFGKRQGRVISADSAHGFGGHFRVLAVSPVQESFHLARELRTQTSGLASLQLVFSHWEIIEQDPYWVPSTKEEYLHFGEKANCAIELYRAKSYMDAICRRKGLSVDF